MMIRAFLIVSIVVATGQMVFGHNCYTYSSLSDELGQGSSASNCNSCQKMILTWISGDKTYIRWCGTGQCIEGTKNSK